MVKIMKTKKEYYSQINRDWKLRDLVEFCKKNNINGRGYKSYQDLVDECLRIYKYKNLKRENKIPSIMKKENMEKMIQNLRRKEKYLRYRISMISNMERVISKKLRYEKTRLCRYITKPIKIKHRMIKKLKENRTTELIKKYVNQYKMSRVATEIDDTDFSEADDVSMYTDNVDDFSEDDDVFEYVGDEECNEVVFINLSEDKDELLVESTDDLEEKACSMDEVREIRENSLPELESESDDLESENNDPEPVDIQIAVVPELRRNDINIEIISDDGQQIHMMDIESEISDSTEIYENKMSENDMSEAMSDGGDEDSEFDSLFGKFLEDQEKKAHMEEKMEEELAEIIEEFRLECEELENESNGNDVDVCDQSEVIEEMRLRMLKFHKKHREQLIQIDVMICILMDKMLYVNNTDEMMLLMKKIGGFILSLIDRTDKSEEVNDIYREYESVFLNNKYFELRYEIYEICENFTDELVQSCLTPKGTQIENYNKTVEILMNVVKKMSKMNPDISHVCEQMLKKCETCDSDGIYVPMDTLVSFQNTFAEFVRYIEKNYKNNTQPYENIISKPNPHKDVLDFLRAHFAEDMVDKCILIYVR